MLLIMYAILAQLECVFITWFSTRVKKQKNKKKRLKNNSLNCKIFQP